MLTLTDEQREAVERMAAEPTRACLNASTTGVGKTVMATELARALDAKTVLVIAPPNTKSGWAATIKGQGIDLPFTEIDSAHTERYDDLKAGVPGVYFISRTYFALSGTSLKPKPRIDKVTKAPMRDEDGNVLMTKGRVQQFKWNVVPDLVIYDEVQAVQNRWSEGFSVLKRLKAGYKLAMSATPNGNRFSGIWPVCRWLWGDLQNPALPYDPEAEYDSMYVDRSEQRWIVKWCETKYNPFNYSGIKVVGERNPGAFVASLPCYVRLEREETPVDEQVVTVDLSPAQRAMYDQMESDMLIWLDDNPLVADIPITQRIRLRQITLGEISFNDEGEVDFAPGCASSKIEALQEILAQHPDEPVMIYLDSARFAPEVARRLGEGAVAWTGGTSKVERERILDAFGADVRYIVATIPAVAEGLDMLQYVCSTEVWLSESLNGMLNIQAMGRLNRTGQAAEVITRYYIHGRDTDDDGRFQKLLTERKSNRASLRMMSDGV